MRTILQRSNPLETVGCDDPKCLPWKPGKGEGGNCSGSGVNYEVECQQCPEGSKSLYIGESARNLFTRGNEHVSRYRRGQDKSFMLKHQNLLHQGEEGVYKAKVTASTRDCFWT